MSKPEEAPENDRRQLMLTLVRIDERTANMEETLGTVNDRLGTLDRRVGAQDERLTNFERRVFNGKGPSDPTAGMPASADPLDRATITFFTLLWRRHWKMAIIVLSCLAAGGTLTQVWGVAKAALFTGGTP